MKKGILFLLLIALILPAVSGCSQDNTGSGRFSNGEVSFSYPSNWKEIKYKKDAQMAQIIEAFIGAPVKLGEFQPNANLTVHDFSSSEDTPGIEALIQAAEEAYNQNGQDMGIQDYRRISLDIIQVDTVQAGLLVSEYTVIDSKTRMKTMQLIVPLKEKAYNLTATSELSQWPEYEPVFKEIIQSFSVI